MNLCTDIVMTYENNIPTRNGWVEKNPISKDSKTLVAYKDRSKSGCDAVFSFSPPRTVEELNL